MNFPNSVQQIISKLQHLSHIPYRPLIQALLDCVACYKFMCMLCLEKEPQLRFCSQPVELTGQKVLGMMSNKHY